MFKAAITGTNGKTSVVFIAAQLMASCGFKAASLGTLGLISDEYSDPDPILVGPDAIPDLAKELESTYHIDGLFFEAFSTSIEAELYDDIDIDVAVLTNISTDHLDYHGSQENYVKAKLRLFEEILNLGKLAVFNHDDDIADTLIEICKKRSIRYLSYGEHENANLKIISINNVGDETQVTIEFKNTLFVTILSFIGEIFVQNWLCALSISLIQGHEIDYLMDSSKSVILPPGRMEKIYNKNIYIDYAHNAVALEAVLKILKSKCNGSLHLIFGCGGDRDKGKRKTMGKIANSYAEKIYITDDNPRTENAEKIRHAVLQYCPKGIEIGNRQEAIRLAISNLKPNDILLVAGKGHETVQEVNGKVYEYSDKNTILELY